MSSTEVRSPATPRVRALPGTVLAMLLRSAGVLAVLAVPVVSGLGSAESGASAERPEQQQSSAWKAAYSERFPGCVPSILWPADENPVALLTRGPDGSVDKVALDRQRQPLGRVPAGARTIGACR